jgi:transcriptional antiterminator NusG
MKFQWFALHVLAGKEQKVRDSILKRLKIDEMEPYIKEVLLPMERVVEVRGGKKTVTNRKLHPGYLYIEMALLDDSRRLLEKPWYFIKGIDGVIGFIGGERPAEVELEEINTIKSAISDAEDTEKPKVHFEVGETVKINDGPFLNFSGLIEEIEPDKGKLKVTVDIFGRKTPVELEYWQVEKT